MLLQSSFLLLECVPGAGRNQKVIEALDRYCRDRGFHRTSVLLDLKRLWPCRRLRWWCLLMPADVALPDLRDFPELPVRPVVGHLIREWPGWHLEQELQLQLSPWERTIFQDPEYGEVDRFLRMDQCAPTLLHSLAHQLLECPCGCRSPSSLDLLRGQGLH